MILCRHCGARIDPDQSICGDCGKPWRQSDLEQISTSGHEVVPQAGRTATDPITVQSRLPRRFPFVVIALGVLVTAIVSVAITLALMSRGGDVRGSNAGVASPSLAHDSAGPGPTGSSSSVTVPVRITATASSMRPPDGATTYESGNALDGSLGTAWDEGVKGPGIGEWIRCDFDRQVKLSSMRIAPGYFKNAQLWAHNNRLAAATVYFSDGSFRHFSLGDRMAEQTFEVGGVRTSWVRMTIDGIYAGSSDSEDTPISEIAFNWEP